MQSGPSAVFQDRKPNTMKVHYSSKKQDWETPQDFFNHLNKAYQFDLDVCATIRNAKCPKFFTPNLNGLAQDWGCHTCWMNPPYGRAIRDWMKKAFASSLSGATVVCLVPARTDTRWWHDYAMKGEIEFVKGRIQFVGAEHPAPFPSAIVVFFPARNPSPRGMTRKIRNR